MADPTGYEVDYSFAGFQASNPLSPLPGASVDNELANIATAIASAVAAIKDVRRSDGALANGIVTYDSLELGLQLTFDPTNGALVAAAVTGAQASATAASGSAVAAAASASAALTQALAAAASSATVNLALYLPKAGNLANMGNNDSALSNIGAMKVDGSTATGRLSPVTGGALTTDWNTALLSGWYSGFTAANQPVFAGTNDWLVEVIAQGPLWVTQIAYPFTLGSTSTSAVVPFRRQGYNNAGVLAWQPWESMATLPIGSTIWVNGSVAPPGYIKENGALLSRATYPALYAYAAASGNIVSEATWSATNSGSFSTGDLSTTFRIPDARGEFIRGFDDSRGVDSGRVIGAKQADALKDHTHSYNAPNVVANQWNSPGSGATSSVTSATGATSGGSSLGAATETRGRNIPKLACIKF